MGLQVELLEKSFAAVAPQGDELTEVFYRNLFNVFPEVKPMFANAEMAEQRKKLLASLKLVVDNLRKPDVLVPALENLGLRHLDFGTLEEHYPAVGQTLLKSLGEIAGPVWTDELNEAWAEAYGEIVKIMLAGATETVS